MYEKDRFDDTPPRKELFLGSIIATRYVYHRTENISRVSLRALYRSRQKTYTEHQHNTTRSRQIDITLYQDTLLSLLSLLNEITSRSCAPHDVTHCLYYVYHLDHNDTPSRIIVLVISRSSSRTTANNN